MPVGGLVVHQVRERAQVVLVGDVEDVQAAWTGKGECDLAPGVAAAPVGHDLDVVDVRLVPDRRQDLRIRRPAEVGDDDTASRQVRAQQIGEAAIGVDEDVVRRTQAEIDDVADLAHRTAVDTAQVDDLRKQRLLA